MTVPSRNENQLRLVRQILDRREAKLEETRTERNALIAALIVDEGRTYREVAELSGLSLPGVAKIAKAAGIYRGAAASQ
jgi:hypothetical protein